MGSYLDLHIIPKVDDAQSYERMANLLSKVQYSTVGLTVPTGLLRERVDSLRQAFEQHGISTALRVDLSPTSRIELLRLLRKFRNQYDLVAVNCLNQRVALVACRDRRVDMVFFNPTSRNLQFTHTFARLLGGAIEFNLVSDVVEQAGSFVFSRIRRAMMIAQEHGAMIVLSSGARNRQMVRSPIEISSLSTSLGLTQEEAIRGVSSAPSSIVSENRKKHAPAYVEEGVQMVAPRGR